MLELRDLVKHYPTFGGEPVRAVDGVSLTVRGRRDGRAVRPEWVGQDHAAVDDRHTARARLRGPC